MKKLLLSIALLLTLTFSFAQIPINFQLTPFPVCSTNGLATFAPEFKNTEILNGLPAANYNITFHETEIDAFNDVNQLPSPYTTSAPVVIFVRVEEIANPANFEITFLEVIYDTGSYFPPQEFIACDQDGDGFGTVNLQEVSDQILSGTGPAAPFIDVTFHLMVEDAEINLNPLTSPFSNTSAFNQTIYARAENTLTGCTTINPVYLLAEYCSVIGIPENLSVCTDTDTACFDLAYNTANVLANVDPYEYTVTYHLSESDAHADSNAIANPDSHCVAVTMESPTIYIRVENISGEYELASFYIHAQQYIAGIGQAQPMAQCDEDANGVVTFDLTSIATLFNITNPAEYYTTSTAAATQQNQIANPSFYSVAPTNQLLSIFIREVVAGNCDIIHSFQIIAYSNCNFASSCATANPLCGVLGVPFENTVNIDAAEPGNYTCLGSQPNPTWFYIPISLPGDLHFQISQVSNVGQGIDVDFICFGPFDSPASCGPANLNQSTEVACSYSIAAIENLSLVNVSPGQFYILMVTNFANQPGQITITQTGGTGAIDCTGLFMTAFLDTNGNGQKDDGEHNFPHGQFHYEMNSNGDMHHIVSPLGYHFIFENDPANTYDISFDINSEFASFYNVNPSSYTDVSVIAGEGANNFWFPVTASEPYNDLQVSIVPTGTPSPGFTYTNKVIYTNLGNTPQSGTITFMKDAALTGLSTVPATTITPTGFTHNFTALQPFESREISVYMNVPTIPTVTLGQTVTNSVQIDPVEDDLVPANNISSVTQEIVGSYDPNDKMESHGRQILITDFTADDYLFYTIRFENTGTAPAMTVRITDLLDPMIDPTSVRMISASHDYVLDRVGNQLTWHFDNIMLPYSTQNPEEAKGYVHFKVKLNPGFAEGDIVPNTAAIFFDFNPAIITNTFETEFVTNMAVGENQHAAFTVYPNPSSEILNVMSNGSELIRMIQLVDISGKSVITKSSDAGQASIEVSSVSSGIYFLQVEMASGSRSVQKIIIE